MTEFPQMKEWRFADGPVNYLLLVDQFGYVTHSETGPTPYVGGSVRFSYPEFLSGFRHQEIRQSLGEAVLAEALLIAGRNELLISNSSPAA